MNQGDFQSQVNVSQAPGVIGDYCDKNPRYSFDAGPGGLVAGANGCTVGHFAWATFPPDGDGTPSLVNSFGLGAPSGFIHREQQGLIVNYLASSGLTIQSGFGVTLMIGGGFWTYNNGATQAQNGQKAFANINDGSVSFAAPGTVSGGGSGATASIAAETWSATLSTLVGNILNTSGGVVTGDIYPGSYITSSGVVGTVVKQLTGTAFGAGTYLIDTGEQSISTPQTIAGAYGLLSNGTVTGAFAVGQVLTGTGVVLVPPTVITYLATGAGGSSGTSVVNNNTVVSSATIVGSNTIETKWFARSTGLPGEVVKMSDKSLG
jgi:hypothetical protein